MPPYEKSAFNLYHGTSTLFLPGIREFGLGGQNILAAWGFYAFIQDLASICEKHCDELENYIFNKMVKQAVGCSNFQHGHAYLSPSKSTAARYATTNAYGSELVSEAMARVKLLTSNNCDIEKLLSNYPIIKAVMVSDCTPILITIPSADRFRLLSEHGRDAGHMVENVLSTLSRDPSAVELYHQQDNFRLDCSVPINELIIESITITSSTSVFPKFTINPFQQ